MMKITKIMIKIMKMTKIMMKIKKTTKLMIMTIMMKSNVEGCALLERRLTTITRLSIVVLFICG